MMGRFGFALALLAGFAGVASGNEFVIRPGGESSVVFTSKAPMETFQGKTKEMRGRIEVDPENPGDSLTIYIEVELASLDTGIEKRNGHMRENHLETDTYPLAVFEGGVVRGVSSLRFVPGLLILVDVEGTFTLHGVSKRLKTTIEYQYAVEDNRREISFKTEFPVSLAAYEIDRPQFLFMKLADEQLVEVRGVAVWVETEEADEGADPSGG